MISLHGLSSSVTPEPNPNPNPNPIPKYSNSDPALPKRKRNLPGTPDPDAEVIAMSPHSLMATNRFVCEICNKGFQRDQNLQLHRRGHNLPWKLKQRTNQEVRKKVYLCPEKTCVHHHPSRALGDLTGIKKHYSRKHGEKRWKCEKCSKKYALQSDRKAHSKICGTRKYTCNCGTLFSRRDSFITHRAFCDALAEENSRSTSTSVSLPNLNFRNELINGSLMNNLQPTGNPQLSAMFRPNNLAGLEPAGQINLDGQKPRLPLWLDHTANSNAFLASELVQATQPTNMYGLSSPTLPRVLKEEENNICGNMGSMYYNNNDNQQEASQSHMSATALLQKAASMGSTRSHSSGLFANGFGLMNSSSLNQGKNDVGNLNGLLKPDNGGDGGGLMLLGEMNNARQSDRMMMMMIGSNKGINENKKQKLQGNSMGCNKVEGSMTRDFLGVGGNGESRPFLQQELAKFASMGGSTMDLSQYRSTNGSQ